jgi:transposase
LDVHREFLEVAICEDGQVRSAGRVPATPEGVQTLAESLPASDRVALEVTGSCWEVARILEPHVNRLVVVSPDDTGITSARAKTDKLDARTLASLLWRGELEAVWMPDERCRLRRRLARREQLVRARSRAKNEIHASLQRRLQAKPPCSDLCGVKGRQWLAGLELQVEERESVDAGIRHIEFLDQEISAVERVIAQRALSWPEMFLTSRKLVAYLGLDPRVKQSGEAPPISGRISKRGSPAARWTLVEAAWTAVLQPGPLHGFYERVKARRGHGKAIVATARKLAILFWRMLTRSEDYPPSGRR